MTARALFTYVRYSMTPTLSVDADHESVTLVEVELETPKFVGWDGGVVSPGGGADGHDAVEAVSCACWEVFPAASRAATPTVYAVPHASEPRVDDVEETVATLAPPLYTS